MNGTAPVALWRRDELADFCRALLSGIGVDAPSAGAATRAMMHASLLGVDSHGVRLLPHYAAGFEGGRLNKRPQMRFSNEGAAVARLDADDGHGALAGYLGMERALALAEASGVGAVAIRNTSHFGAAGAYALAAAEAGCIGLSFCNSDSFVRLHAGAERFHGTNPIAMAVPAGLTGERPWLLDMATSAIPYNRVQLYKSLGLPLPLGTASTDAGVDTQDPHAAEMLAPLGGEFGFKGAGLAGIPEILSAVLTGMRLSFDILPMPGPDMETPRAMGAFVMALRPSAFVDPQVFEAGMQRYLSSLRGSRTADGGTVMAPGDREWAEATRREREGIPVDPATSEAFTGMAGRLGIPIPKPRATATAH